MSQISVLVGQNAAALVLDANLPTILSESVDEKALAEEVDRTTQSRKEKLSLATLQALLRPFQEQTSTSAVPKVSGPRRKMLISSL